MDNLKRLIGLAPSEMEFPLLLKKITKRREIIGSDLHLFRESLSGIKKVVKRTSTKKPKKTFDAMASNLGVDMATLEDMKKQLMEAVKKEKEDA